MNGPKTSTLSRPTGTKAALASVAALSLPILAGGAVSARTTTATAGMWGEAVLSQEQMQYIDNYLADLGWDENDIGIYGYFWEAGYSYVQLLTLAEEWNVGEFEAKARAARAIQSGDTSVIFEVLSEGPAAEFMTAEEIDAADMAAYSEEFGAVEPPAATVDVDYDELGWSESDLDVYPLFWEAGYSYEQLLALADAWNVGEFEAKARAGRAIQSGDVSIIDEVLG